jgi:hypothetical protein
VYGFGVWANFLTTTYTAYFVIPDAITGVLVQVRLPLHALLYALSAMWRSSRAKFKLTYHPKSFFAERAYRLTNNSKIFLVIAALLMYAIIPPSS